MSRWTRFFIVLIIGIALGLVYAWVVNPVEYTDTTLDNLRQDYKTDYALMVAEAYQVEGDLDVAVSRLMLLGGKTPQESLRQAILFASRLEGYPLADLSLLRALSQDVQSHNPTLEKSTP
ncbi:MAG: hypothetical protein PVG32_14910 [Anaerolineales bacterium]|jgi:hypothetical protein